MAPSLTSALETENKYYDIYTAETSPFLEWASDSFFDDQVNDVTMLEGIFVDDGKNPSIGKDVRGHWTAWKRVGQVREQDLSTFHEMLDMTENSYMGPIDKDFPNGLKARLESLREHGILKPAKPADTPEKSTSEPQDGLEEIQQSFTRLALSRESSL